MFQNSELGMNNLVASPRLQLQIIVDFLKPVYCNLPFTLLKIFLYFIVSQTWHYFTVWATSYADRRVAQHRTKSTTMLLL